PHPPLVVLVCRRRLGLFAEPRHERRDVRGRDLGQALALGEVLQRVGVEEARVFGAGVLSKATSAAALIAGYPPRRVGVERDARALLELATVDIRLTRGLRSPGFVDGAKTLPAL